MELGISDRDANARTHPLTKITARWRGSDVPPILSSTSVESPIIRKGRSGVKKRFTEAQIIGFLREAEAGLPVKDLCRRHGFSEASYYLWRSKFGGLSVSDAKRLKELETEDGRLKKLLAESQLEIEVTREVAAKTMVTAPVRREVVREMVARGLSERRALGRGADERVGLPVRAKARWPCGRPGSDR